MIETIWLGSAESLREYIDAKTAYSADPQLYSNTQEGDEKPLSRLLEIVGDTAIISVDGGLVPGSKPWYRFFGVVGYQEIVEALEAAALEEDVKQIVMRFTSGGGSAVGVAEAAEFIRYVDAEFKPVYTFTDTAAFSAAYWLYSAGRKQYVSEMGQLGSIGAIATHVSYKGALDKAGIEYTVFREGEYKALGQPFEKLDDKARKVFQERLYAANQFFLAAVIKNRSVMPSDSDKWGEGKTFFGREGVLVGLADEVIPFHKLITGLSTNGRLADSTTTYQDEGFDMKHQDSQAGGGETTTALNDEMEHPTAEQLEDNQVELDVSLIAGGVDLSAPEETGDIAEEEETEEQLSEEVPNPTAGHEVELANLQAKFDTLNEQFTDLQETADNMKTALLRIADRFSVALGATRIDLSHLDAKTAFEHFAKLEETMLKTFPAGRKTVPVAQTELHTEVQAKASSEPPIHAMVREHQTNKKP